jgi:hypothetical protein
VHCNIRVSPPSLQGAKLLRKVCRRKWKWKAVRSSPVSNSSLKRNQRTLWFW